MGFPAIYPKKERIGVLYFDEYGDRKNPMILMLHGAGALDTFCRQYCFAEKYHLVVPHLPGAGKAAGLVYDPISTVQELAALIEHFQKEKIGVVGHSLGGQLAVRLVCTRPEFFCFAVFLSAWVNPTPEAVKRYGRIAGMSARMLHWKWLVRMQGRYWKYTEKQADYMAEYSKKITPEIYQSFFTGTLNLEEYPEYISVCVPMFAACGDREVKDMKTSLRLLGRNSHCQTIMMHGLNHDFPMRHDEVLNPYLEKIFCDYAK